MPSNRRVRLSAHDETVAELLRDGIAAIQTELDVTPEFPADVIAAAEEAAANPRLPDLDRTEIEFVTIDPESAQDLDQALHIERDGEREGGYIVHYAIADVAAFVQPGDPVDREARKRGETLYGADSKIPLHPPVLSENAASLLAGQVRPALLWTIRVDASGEGTDVNVERAMVKSRAKLSYEAAQAEIDSGTAGEVLLLLREIGEKRIAREAEVGGVSLPLPEQEVEVAAGVWRLEFRSLLPVEQWNAQISLLTGFAAASLMVYARVGILRTLPDADPRDVRRLHRTAEALGIEWPAEQLYPDFIRSLDATRSDHAAMVIASARLLRGSGYASFDGEVPAEPQHAGLASEYAHVTAPLRRLVDRFAGEICVALCAEQPVPDWVTEAMSELPAIMQRSGNLARRYENAVLNLVEAALLHDQVGQEFTGTVLSADPENEAEGVLMVREWGVEAPVTTTGRIPVGEDIRARLVTADVPSRSVSFQLIES